MDSDQIRQLWTSFFAERGHRAVPSSSLIPPPDERTLLFTNAGMNQMKPYFMGLADPPARRMTSIQKCFRTSDIEEVGDSSHCTFFEMLGNFSVGDYFKAEVIPWAVELITASVPNGLGLDKDRIWVTVFEDDDEAFELWRGCGIPAERIVRFDESENYWFMIKGGAGPCGPNTEVYYDFGPEFGCGKPDCRPPLHTPPDCNRFLEIWNLVFMALYQEEDGKTRRPLPMQNVDTGAGLERWLPVHMWQAGIDWQGKPRQWDSPPSIYDTDLFRPIIARVEELTGLSYDTAAEEQRRAIRVVAEHTRAATFLIADGVTPANDGRGYVLRRLIRRGTSYGQRLKPGQQFLAATAESVIERMAPTHENLHQQREFVLRTLQSEERRFARTIQRGEEILRGMVKSRQRHGDAIRDIVRFARGRNLSPENAGLILEQHGFVAFDPDSSPVEKIGEEIAAGVASDFLYDDLARAEEGDWDIEYGALASWPDALTAVELVYLYDTFGLPSELSIELADEFGLRVPDQEELKSAMQEQRARSRAAAQFDGGVDRAQTYAELALPRTEFLGYDTTTATATVLAILLSGAPVDSAGAQFIAPEEGRPAGAETQRIEVVLDRTPFYAEGGGQVGDQGLLLAPESAAGPDSASPREARGQGGAVPARFVVEDTQAVGEGGVTAHIGRLEAGSLRVGDTVEARVDEARRADTMRNHTATHILHAALRHVLGTHVRQAGSLVTPDRLRFDFTHLEAMTPEQMREVEALANRVVRDNLTVHVDYMPYEKALEEGALAFFGDKYAETVRVVGVCDVELHDCFSHELCGGTHVHHSGEVGAIVITGETSIGAGMRRIEAVTGRAAWERTRGDEDALARLSARLRVPADGVEARVEGLLSDNERLRRQVQTLERQIARQSASGSAGSTEAEAVPEVAGVPVIVRQVPEASSADFLRDVGDALKQRHKTAVILLGAMINEKPTFVAMSTADVAQKCPAGDVVRAAAQAAGGNGGGRPESAQGGGTDPSKLEAALAAARKLIEERLTS